MKKLSILFFLFTVQAFGATTIYHQLTTNVVFAGSGITITTTPKVGTAPGTATISSTGGGGGAVDSVNGFVGVVVLNTTDIAEALNLYWTANRSNNLVLSILGPTNDLAFLSAANVFSASNHIPGAFEGSGINLTNLNAAQLAIGIVPSARYAGAGVNSVKLGSSAAAGGNSVSIGRLADSSGSNSIAIGFGALGQNQSSTALGDAANAAHANATAIGQNSSTTKAHQVMLGTSSDETRAAGTLIADGVITGDGSGLTNLTASGGVSVAAGTNIFLTTNSGIVTIAGPQIMWGLTTTNTITNSLSKGTMMINIGGGVTATSFTGSGAALTTITAANVTGTGTLPDGVLSANVPLLNAAQTFSGANTFSVSETNTGSMIAFNHLHGGTAKPTIVPNTLTYGASSTATLDANATDTAGTITFTPQNTANAVAFMWTNTWSRPYSNAPHVVLTPFGRTTSALLRNTAIESVSTTTLIGGWSASESMTGGTSYQFTYHVIE